MGQWQTLQKPPNSNQILQKRTLIAAGQNVKRGDLTGAIEDFNKAIDLKPGWFYAYARHGFVKQHANLTA